MPRRHFKVSPAQLAALITYTTPEGSVKLTNIQVAKILRLSITTIGTRDNSSGVSKWMNGHTAMPERMYELLAAKMYLLNEGLATLEELCNGLMIHDCLKRSRK
jgi:hypothetical protein